MAGGYLGPSFSQSEIKDHLGQAGAVFTELDDDAIIQSTVKALVAEKAVGWFQGRMEFGPRALGARSIIGDPRSATMQATMNLKIKFRESFRPFAPCVLKEDAAEYFALHHESPYMLLVAPVLEKHRRALSAGERATMTDPDLRKRVNVRRSSIPAVTHVDYSARVQTVDEERHGRFYRLMKRFKDKTGCGVVINTSFNIRGEPIVCTPQDAYRCFLGTNMDALVLGNHLLLRDEQPNVKSFDAESYKASFKLD